MFCAPKGEVSPEKERAGQGRQETLLGPPHSLGSAATVPASQGGPFLPSLQPVRGGFARIQRSLAELRALPTEGAFQQVEDGMVVAQAVKDGLQQFKQVTRQSSAGASFVEVRRGREGARAPGRKRGEPRGGRNPITFSLRLPPPFPAALSPVGLLGGRDCPPRPLVAT